MFSKTPTHDFSVTRAARTALFFPKVARLFRSALLASLLCAAAVRAQEPTPADFKILPAPTTPTQITLNFISSVEAPADSRPPIEAPSLAPVEPTIQPKNDRLFFLLPNYLTVENHPVQVAPLSVSNKFRMTEKTMTDPVTVSFLGVIALVGQARNSDPSYGQGLQGYAKRYGTIYADTGLGTLMTGSVFPIILHQDPRYFQMGSGGFLRRTRHALTSIFITRSDQGAVQFNYSEIVGNAVAAGISNTYHPESQRTLGDTLGTWGTNILLNSLCNIAKEFWPDMRQKLRHSQPD